MSENRGNPRAKLVKLARTLCDIKPHCTGGEMPPQEALATHPADSDSPAVPDGYKLVPVEPQPTFIESSGRWSWDLPDHCRYPGCSHSVVTASREWWEYVPSEAKPHPMAEGVMLRDSMWYWAIAAAPSPTDGGGHHDDD